MTIEKGNIVSYPDGEMYLVSSTNNGIHGVRVTDEELNEGADLGCRDRLYLGADESELEAQGAQIFEIE
jgi:hypothetical protein